MENHGLYSTPTFRSFAEARKRVEEKAALEGFRILQVHDLKEALGEKGFGIEPTVILEICNAGMAYEAFQLDPHAALMMPCKVIVQERGGEVTLLTPLPESWVDGEALQKLARRVGVRLKALVDGAAQTPSGCCSI